MTCKYSECSGLTSVVIPNSVTSIDYGTFAFCGSLTSIGIPHNITSIGRHAFLEYERVTNVYCYAEDVPITNSDAFDELDLDDITLHVPSTSVDAYHGAEPWSGFGKIVALPEIVPMEEDVEVAFEECITEDTDLADTVIENVYVTFDTNGEDGYDTEEKCIVLTSTMTEEQLEGISNREVSDATVKDNYSGLILEVPTGKGTISINVQTKGSRALNIKIGEDEAQTFVQSERGEVEIPYTATEDTYVYIYGGETESSAKRRISGGSTENGILIYGIRWTASVPSYTLTYVVDGETYKTYEVEYGEAITPEDEPTKDNGTFSGWSLIPETMPAEDVTVTGSFTLVDAIKGIQIGSNEDDADWYTIDGRKLKGRPTQKGLYIKDGKKVLLTR